MNTFYIGPYRQKNLNGCLSNSIIEYLVSKKPEKETLTARPIYLEKNIKPRECANEIVEAERNIADKYDLVIQNATLEALIPIASTRNYFMPITNNRNLSNEELVTLNNCDKILVDNIFDYSRFSNIFGEEKTLIFDYDVKIQQDVKTINLGLYNHMQKMYFIGDYAKNIELIKSLIVSFILFSRNRENICIFFFLTDQNASAVNELKKFSEYTYQHLNITNAVTRTLFLNANTEEDSINQCHKSCDIFLDLNEESRHSYNRKYAEAYGNYVIGPEKLEFYSNATNNGLINENGFSIPTQISVMRAMENITTKQNSEINKHKLETLIWN